MVWSPFPAKEAQKTLLALFGQGCLVPGMGKATYGTGSSILLDTRESPCVPGGGPAVSLAWLRGGKASCVLEGNVNYTGSAIDWLFKEVGLISSAKEAGPLAERAKTEDTCCLLPAFTSLGAPFYDSSAKAAFVGITRSTGRNEMVKAAQECIGQQIADVVKAFGQMLAAQKRELFLQSLCADGGSTSDRFLMQFQSDILRLPVLVAPQRAFQRGDSLYGWVQARHLQRRKPLCWKGKRDFYPLMGEEERRRRRALWKDAVERVRK